MNSHTTLPVTNQEMIKALETNAYNYSIDMGVNFTPILEKNIVVKQKFYEAFGPTGRKVLEVSLEKNTEDMESLVNDFMRSLGVKLYQLIKEYFSIEELSENILTENKSIKEYELELQKGMKFSKALLKITEKLKYSNLRKEETINKYSLVLNEKKVGGVLVLSVNPLDFYTMSWGTNWSTCLGAGGEFESGTMGLAVDSNSLISFFISSKDIEKLHSNLPVPKKWRKIFTLDKDHTAFLANKGYPYDGNELTEISAIEIQRLFFSDSETVFNKYKYEEMFNRVRSYKVGPGYSDVGLNRQIYVYAPKELSKDFKVEFRFGEDFDCLHCQGGPAADEAFACMFCGDYDSCEDCGESIARDTGYWTAYSTLICERCCEDNYAWAEDDDELHHVENLAWIESSNIFITLDSAVSCDSCSEYVHEDDAVNGLCPSCHEEETKEKEKEEKADEV